MRLINVSERDAVCVHVGFKYNTFNSHNVEHGNRTKRAVSTQRVHRRPGKQGWVGKQHVVPLASSRGPRFSEKCSGWGNGHPQQTASDRFYVALHLVEGCHAQKNKTKKTKHRRTHPPPHTDATSTLGGSCPCVFLRSCLRVSAGSQIDNIWVVCKEAEQKKSRASFCSFAVVQLYSCRTVGLLQCVCACVCVRPFVMVRALCVLFGGFFVMPWS